MLKRGLYLHFGLATAAVALASWPARAQPCEAVWDGTIGTPGMMPGIVLCLTVFDDGTGPALYAGGTFTEAGGVSASHIAKWDGISWSPLGSGANDNVFALAVYDDGTGPALFVGGAFSEAGGLSANGVAWWNGHRWGPLGDGVGRAGGVIALTVFDDGSGSTLYAAGIFNEAGGAPARNIAKWDGLRWSPLGSGLDTAIVQALAVFDDGTGPALYAGGFFLEAGGVSANRIAKWDGASWSALGSGLNDPVRAMTVFDDGTGPALFVGGQFTHAGGVSVNNIAWWNGHRWGPLASGVDSLVQALCVFDDGTGSALYVGGAFDTAGNVTASGIARWYTGSWSALGSGVGGRDNNVWSLTVFDDTTGPALYAGGLFSSAGGEEANRIAKWGCPFPLGDMNCDGEIDALDIEPYLLALFEPDEYLIRFPNCDINNADINRDGSIDALDIEPFLNLLFP